LKTYRLTREQFVPLGQDDVFAFFADARNLERLTPPWLHFEILTPSPVDMHAGMEIDYKLRLHGVPVRWQSEITIWQPPCRFADRQRRGPYRLWVHTHSFEAMAGGTLVSDAVDYAVPGGGLVERFFVRPDLERIFDYRSRQLDAWVIETLRGGGSTVVGLTESTAAR
jgi:ligand-binding SRPBCC domain-containing protein